MTGETPPLLFSAMAKKKDPNQTENKGKTSKKKQASSKPKFKNMAEARAYVKKNYGSAKVRREKKAGLGAQKASTEGFKGKIAETLGLDSKSKIQDFASKDYKKEIGKRLNKAVDGSFKEATRKYAAMPIQKLLHKAMGGGAMAGIVSRHVSKMVAPELRDRILGGIQSVNKHLGDPLGKLNNKATDFAAKLADSSRQKTLKYGEQAGFLPKGATERYNDPKKQKLFQEQQQRKEK